MASLLKRSENIKITTKKLEEKQRKKRKMSIVEDLSDNDSVYNEIVMKKTFSSDKKSIANNSLKRHSVIIKGSKTFDSSASESDK